MSRYSISPPGRSGGNPWVKLILMVIALAVVVWLIMQLNTMSTEHLTEYTPDVETESPTPPSIEVDVVPDITPPPADDPMEDDSVTPPPMPDDLSAQSEMEKMVLDRIRSTVTHVFDGDTVMLADGTRLRYVGIDTPEKNEPFFTEAGEFNRRLVLMKPVQYDVCKKKPKDQYGRTLATVHAEGQPVEDMLLGFGLAEPFHDPDCVPDCRHAWKLTIDAFRKKRGMFADAADEPTPAIVADRLLGHYGMVVGVVDNLREAAASYHLNFGSDWTTDFSATIAKSDLDQFLRDKLDPRQLVGMKLTLFGKVISSYGPRIFLVCPAQIVQVSAP